MFCCMQYRSLQNTIINRLLMYIGQIFDVVEYKRMHLFLVSMQKQKSSWDYSKVMLFLGW